MLQLLPVALEPALQQFLALLFSFHEVAGRRRGFFFFQTEKELRCADPEIKSSMALQQNPGSVRQTEPMLPAMLECL